MAKDARARRESAYRGGALMGALGTAMTAGASWYDKQQQEKAKALREAELLKLKQGELDLGYKKLEASDKIAQERNKLTERQIAATEQASKDIQSRFESGEKSAGVGKFLSTDFKDWKANYVGDDEDAKLRAKAWSSVFEQGLENYTEEQLADLAATISEQFGTGSTGKPLLSPSDITAGVSQLRTYAKMRGLDPNDITDDDIRSLLSSSFIMGEEPAAGMDGEMPLMGTDPNAPEAPPEPGGPRFGGASRALFGEEGEDWLEQANQNMWEPYFKYGRMPYDAYQKYIGQPVERGIKSGAKAIMGIE